MQKVAELNETGILQSLNKPLTKTQVRRLKRIISRLEKDEPLEHILRSCTFHGRNFHTSRDALIPRVETETLVDLTVAYALEKQYSDDHTISIVDVGTGSGCVIIATALTLREQAKYYATDISKKALSLAKKNILTHKLGKGIKTFEGNLLEPIDEKVSFDIIVANLPYVRSAEIDTLRKSVRDFEPRVALDGGKDGIDRTIELLTQAVDRIASRGVILLELQPDNIGLVKKQAESFFPGAALEVVPDTFKRNRFLVVKT